MILNLPVLALKGGGLEFQFDNLILQLKNLFLCLLLLPAVFGGYPVQLRNQKQEILPLGGFLLFN